MSEQPTDRRGPGATAARSRDRGRDARLRVHGQGALERLPDVRHVAWPPPLLPRLVASPAATRPRSRQPPTATATSAGRPTGATSSPTRRSGCSTTAGRTPCTPSRRSPRPRPASTSSARSRSAATPTRRTRSGRASAATGVKHLCGFNYRFVPAVQARPRADRGRRARRDPPLQGALPPGLGRGSGPRHLALQPRGGGLAARSATWRRTSSTSRRFLVGEIAALSGLVKTFVPAGRSTTRSRRSWSSTSGAIGTIEATRLALGRRNAFQWEINGSKGSLWFDMERMNELQVFRADGDRARGAKTVLVTEADHPFMRYWWPPGHIVGWGDTFLHEVVHLLEAIARRRRRRARTGRTSRTATGRARSATRSSARRTSSAGSRSRTARPSRQREGARSRGRLRDPPYPLTARIGKPLLPVGRAADARLDPADRKSTRGAGVDAVHVVTNRAFAAAFLRLGEARERGLPIDFTTTGRPERRPARRDRRHRILCRACRVSPATTCSWSRATTCSTSRSPGSSPVARSRRSERSRPLRLREPELATQYAMVGSRRTAG